MKRLCLSIAVSLAVLLIGWPSEAQSGYKVIVNQANPENSLSKDEISRLLLKKRKSWANGVPVSPVDLDGKSSVREAFSVDIHKGRSVSSIKSYWQRQIFSGSSVPPPELGSDEAVIAHVRSNPGGIGYVDASARTDGVKVITVTE